MGLRDERSPTFVDTAGMDEGCEGEKREDGEEEFVGKFVP